jgi:acyl-CoA thioesterase
MTGSAADETPDPTPGESPEELARRCARVMWSSDEASATLGMELLEAGPGRAVVAMTVRTDMVNGWAVCHGGLVATLADSAFAVACNSRGQVTVAAGFAIDLVEPARLGDRLVAVAREVLVRGRSGIYDVTVTRTGDDGPVTVAAFRGRSRATGRSIG